MRLLIIFICCCYCSANLYAQEMPIKKAQLLADFDIFIGSLREGHGGMYYSIDSVSFRRKADSVRRSIGQENTTEAFYLKLRYLLTLLCHGHSRIKFPIQHPVNFKMAVLDSNKKYLPLNIQFIGDKLYVIDDCSNEQSIPSGTEIVAINGLSVKQLFSTMLRYMPAEGVNTSFKVYNLNNYYYFHFLYNLLYPSTTTFDISIAGVKKVKTIGAKKPTAIAATYLAKKGKDICELDKPLAYKQLSAGLAYVKVGSFYKGFIEYKQQSYQRFLDSAFGDIQDKQNKKLILDLRGNEGGGDNYADILLGYLLPGGIPVQGMSSVAGRSFKYSEYAINLSDDVKMFIDNPGEFLENDTSLNIKEKYVRMMDNSGSTLPSSKYRFDGDIYVLMDGGTFSASDLIVSTLFRKRTSLSRKIIFAGEENGGDIFRGASCSGQSYTVQLPNSKIIVDMPFLCSGNLQNKYPKKRLPDWPIENNINALVEGKDHLLNILVKKISR